MQIALISMTRFSSCHLVLTISLSQSLSVQLLGYSQEAPLPASYRIKYRSIDRVYLEGGKADGLMQGDKIGLYLGDRLVVMLEVAYASDHSASCKIISGEAELKTGQMLAVVSRVERPEAVAIDGAGAGAPTATTVTPTTSTTRPKRDDKVTRVYGSAALQWMTQHDQSGGGIDFSQTTMRLNSARQ